LSEKRAAATQRSFLPKKPPGCREFTVGQIAV
jgi:hypothetical protein